MYIYNYNKKVYDEICPMHYEIRARKLLTITVQGRLVFGGNQQKTGPAK